MTVTLAFDTSAEFCAAAFLSNGIVVAEQSLAMERGHAEILVPMIKQLADSAALKLSDVDLIAVVTGPGSYTGIRTGIAAAYGFALGSGATVLGVSSMVAVAHAARRKTGSAPTIFCILDTRRNDYFGQLFGTDNKPVNEPSVMEAVDLRKIIDAHRPVLAGNAVGRLLTELPARYGGLPRFAGNGTALPADVAVIAGEMLHDGRMASDMLSPLYLRKAITKLSAAIGGPKDQ